VKTLGDIWHHRYDDSWYICVFHDTCQHGHVSAAVGSGGGQNQKVDRILL
jgi:hypothetical protein